MDKCFIDMIAHQPQVQTINAQHVHIITQNGEPYMAYTDYGFACDRYHMLETEFPWFKWKLVTTSVN